jgi:hypothetical protein
MADAPIYPFTVRIGDTETITLTLQSSGTAVNITGRTYAAQIRDTAASTAVIATMTCTVTSGTGGSVQCTLAATTTAALTAGQAVYDIQETNSTVKTTLLQGPCYIVQDVTR